MKHVLNLSQNETKALILLGGNSAESHSRIIYGCYARFDLTRDKWIDKYNSARADLIAHLIDPPKKDPYTVPYDPSIPGDPTYWFVTRAFGFTHEELEKLCPGFWTFQDTISMEYRTFIPLLKYMYRTWQKSPIKYRIEDEYLSAFYNARHSLLRYYLDAVYHEINR